MHRTWRESNKCVLCNKEVTRVLEACKSEAVDNLWHGREKEQLGDEPSKRSRYAHPVASSDGSDVLRGQKLPPGITTSALCQCM